jgi:transcriptional regulator with XRE-family HTH domain
MAVDQGGPGAGAPGGGRSESDRPPADTAQPAEPHGDAADPASIATQPDFGRELTRARQRAGLTVREVARAANIPASTAGDYFAGRHLPPPSQPGLLPRILAACGETDPARLRDWAAALTRVRRVPGRRPAAAAPYRGLASFQPKDAAWFFGREDLTARLVELASGRPDGHAPGVPLTVVGPSGSGKSSLLRAGLIPAVSDRAGSRLVLFTPGAAPLAELARQLAGLATTGSGTPAGPEAVETSLRDDPAGAAGFIGPAERPVIIVDQFEEVFTAGLDEAALRTFISAVCGLGGPAVVVLALRADFYAHALRYPELARALQERQVVVGPMTRDDGPAGHRRACPAGPAGSDRRFSRGATAGPGTEIARWGRS